jgi:acetyl-CoA C-acetyltransferase
MREVYIVGAARTAVGSFMGALSTIPATKLGSIAVEAAVKRAGISPNEVDEVYIGNILSAGLGQAPARQVSKGAGIPNKAACVTVNKVCGSGLKTIVMGTQAIKCGDADVVVAGGMENMSLSPYILAKARSGYRMGNDELLDTMIKDGLWDPYNNFHMGDAAELCAKEYKITREEQDIFAAESYKRALNSIRDGKFADEIVPVDVPQRKGDPLKVSVDEEPSKGNIDKLPTLKPAFKKDGTITAGNASKINDGAAAVVLMSKEKMESLKLKPLARVVGYAGFATAPEWFTIAPADSIKNALARTKLQLEDIDLFEINEAFSVVSVVQEKLLKLDRNKVNVYGGAVALGHPIGASGTRIMVTLLNAMKHENKKRGLASLCIGGGEAIAMIVER